MTGFKSAKDYFESQPEQTKKALEEIKECILQLVPEANELLNYNIPAYALVKDGKREEQIMMAGFKKHVGFYPHPTTMIKFDEELEGYKKAKGSVQFTLNQPMPIDLIKNMIQYRYDLITNK